MRTTVSIVALLAILSGCQQTGGTMLMAEPEPGKLRTGAIVLVDDGSCPVGQVKQVTGGSPGVDRQRQCVARPAGL